MLFNCKSARHEQTFLLLAPKPFSYPLTRFRGENIMDKYRCSICGYIYDPEAGDSSSGIPAGTSFDDLPDDWKCPICGADKDQFEKE